MADFDRRASRETRCSQTRFPIKLGGDIAWGQLWEQTAVTGCDKERASRTQVATIVELCEAGRTSTREKKKKSRKERRTNVECGACTVQALMTCSWFSKGMARWWWIMVGGRGRTRVHNTNRIDPMISEPLSCDQVPGPGLGSRAEPSNMRSTVQIQGDWNEMKWKQVWWSQSTQNPDE